MFVGSCRISRVEHIRNTEIYSCQICSCSKRRRSLHGDSVHCRKWSFNRGLLTADEIAGNIARIWEDVAKSMRLYCVCKCKFSARRLSRRHSLCISTPRMQQFCKSERGSTTTSLFVPSSWVFEVTNSSPNCQQACFLLRTTQYNNKSHMKRVLCLWCHYVIEHISLFCNIRNQLNKNKYKVQWRH